MKSLFHRYTKDNFELSSESRPSVFTYEMLPWIEKNSLALRNDGGGIVPIPRYADDFRLQNPAALAITKKLKDDGLTLLFNPRLKLGANNSLFFIDVSDEQKKKNKVASVRAPTYGTMTVFDHPAFVPGNVEEVRQALRDFEKYAERYGWLLDQNPFFWRYFYAFSRVMAELSDSESNVAKAFGLVDGRVYNYAYLVITIDWVVKHHKRLGDHVIPLVAQLISWLNLDPVASKEVINEVNSHHTRSRLTLAQRRKISGEFLAVIHGTTTSNKALAFHAQKNLQRDSWKPFEHFFLNAFFSDFGVEPTDHYLKRMTGRATNAKGERIDIGKYKRQRISLAVGAEKEFTRLSSHSENFHAYIDSLPDPLVIFKGAVVLATENIREGKGGKGNKSHLTLSDAHLKRVGVSFTVNPLVAEWFATKSFVTLLNSPVSGLLPEGKIRPVVIRYEVAKKDVFFVTDSRSEAEVMIGNERALTIRDYQFCFPAKAIGDIEKSDAIARGEKELSGSLEISIVNLGRFSKFRLEDPSLKAAKRMNLSFTTYPDRHNVTSLLHPQSFGRGWLEELKLHKKFIGGHYENVYDSELWSNDGSDEG